MSEKVFVETVSGFAGAVSSSKPKCKLVGTDGNVFALAGRVGVALKKARQADKAKEFYARLRLSHSYEEALALMREYVDVV